MPSTKRPGEDAEDPGNPPKKQANASSRTGQACDRCKVRKIKCDARVGGCSPCLQNNMECRTTDRITGRATSRGHTEKIEGENASLRTLVAGLQQQLRDSGIEPRADLSVAPRSPSLPPPQDERHITTGADDDEHTGAGAPQAHNKPLGGSALPGFRRGLIGDNYLGVSTGGSWLSPIEGTSLTLFGMRIDLADYIASDGDAEPSSSSYGTFLDGIFGGRQQAFAPSLPPYPQCKVMAQWYFRSIQQFVPILHKPDQMDLLSRIFGGTHQPNAAETVSMHMMVATVTFQYSSRNRNEATRRESMQHYYYALGFVPELIKGHQLQDIQALAMICQYLRSQPRVGAAWMFTNMVLGLAIELGLHRSAKAWPQQLAEADSHTIEMRKRIFWSLVLIHSTIGGKLGRPMPLRVEDFDIEIPEAIDDSLPEDGNLSQWRKCSFRAATKALTLTKIEMQVWSVVYSINTQSTSREASLEHLEKELHEFGSQLPVELQGGPDTQVEDRITALYLQLVEHEIRLLMHHPARCRSTSARVIAEGYDVCLNSADKLRQIAWQLKELNALDTTWYYAADFLAAIFTTLFIYTERKDQITSTVLQQLRADMDTWLDVMTEVGNLLGSGPELAGAIRGIVEQSLNSIGRHLAAKTASAAITSTTSPSVKLERASSQQLPRAPPAMTSYPDNNGHSHSYPGDGVDAVTTSQATPYHVAHTGQHQSSQHAYPAGHHFPYSQQQEGAIPHYAAPSTNAYSSETYDSSEGMKASIVDQIARQPLPSAHQQHGAPGYLHTYQSPQLGQNEFQPLLHMNAWRDFTDNMMNQFGGNQPDMAHNASLMSLGPDANRANVDLPAVIAGWSVGNMHVGNGQQPWPLIHYNAGPDGQGDVVQ